MSGTAADGRGDVDRSDPPYPPDQETRLTDVRRRFDEMEEYDSSIRLFVPGYEEMLEVVRFLLAEHEPPPREVVDLGAGTGAVSAVVGEALPGAAITAVDFSQAMLGRARQRLAPFADRVRFIESDLRHAELPDAVDAVVSCLAVHHLEHEDKRALFQKVAQALPSGGLFVLCDVVAMAGATTEQRVETWWRAFLEESCRGTDIDPDDVLEAGGHDDRPATVHDQVAWLSEVGFSEATPLWQRYNMAAIVAVR